MTDFGKILTSVQESRAKISVAIDTFYSEIEGLLVAVSECPSSTDMWEYRDRFEEIRAKTYRFKKSTQRNLAEAEFAYNDGMRSSMSKMKSTNGMHFEERNAEYQTRNITQYKILDCVKRVVDDVDTFSWYLNGRLRWVKDRQHWLAQREQFFAAGDNL